MTCSYCGARNSVGEHRCRRCGRKSGDLLTGEFTHGALAAKLEPLAPASEVAQAVPPAKLPRPVQASLFQPASNVIPFESYAPVPPPPARPRKQAPRRAPRVPEGQGRLDFLPAMQPKPRTLSTTVEAVICCEAPVATTLHRAVAAALDWSMVLISYGMFLLVFRLMGGEFVLSRTNTAVFCGALILVALTYGMFWAVGCTESAGMRWTRLRLTTFEGFPPEARQRLLRFAGSCLSVCTVVGLLWSLADEESLTWQDHISGTFPTPACLESRVFRRG